MEVHLTNLQRDRFYVCSTVERAEQFGRSPGVYLDGVKKIVRQTPCLHALLRVREEDSPPSTVGMHCSTLYILWYELHPRQNHSSYSMYKYNTKTASKILPN